MRQIKDYQSYDNHEALEFVVNFFKRHPEAIGDDIDGRLLGLQVLASADELAIVAAS